MTPQERDQFNNALAVAVNSGDGVPFIPPLPNPCCARFVSDDECTEYYEWLLNDGLSGHVYQFTPETVEYTTLFDMEPRPNIRVIYGASHATVWTATRVGQCPYCGCS